VPDIADGLPVMRHKKKAVLDCCCVSFCCDHRCVPFVVALVDGVLTKIPNPECEDRLPESLDIELFGTPTIGSDTCFNGTGTLTFKTALDGGTECWEGNVTGSCLDCNGAAFNWAFKVVLCCLGNRRYSVGLSPISGTICPALTLGVEADASMCDPLLIEGCWPRFGGCFVGCLDENQMPTDQPAYDVCFLISESP
jgi:hypothetical protein